MSTFSFNCPGCGSLLTVDNGQRGKKGLCPYCSKKFMIPLADQGNLFFPGKRTGADEGLVAAKPAAKPETAATAGYPRKRMTIDGKFVNADDICAALAEEFAGNREFVVLESGDEFIQTAAGELEYSSEGRLFRVSNTPVAREDIRNAFLCFYRDDRRYQTMFVWQEVDLDSDEVSYEDNGEIRSGIRSGSAGMIGKVLSWAVGILIFLGFTFSEHFSFVIESESKDTVNNIMKNAGIANKCVKVGNLPGLISFDDKYNLTAEMDNGEKIPFTATRKGDNFLVEIKGQLTVNMKKSSISLVNEIMSNNGIENRCVKIHDLPDSIMASEDEYELTAEMDNGEKIPFTFKQDKNNNEVLITECFTVQMKRDCEELLNKIMSDGGSASKCVKINNLPESITAPHDTYILTAEMDNGKTYLFQYRTYEEDGKAMCAVKILN